MPEGDAVSRAKRTGLEQRILHPGYLLLHGLERLPDDRRTHLAGAQITHFLDLQQVKKGITLGDGYQSGLFPSRQLTRREPKYAKQVCSTVSVHGCKGLSFIIIESSAPLGKEKLDSKGIIGSNLQHSLCKDGGKRRLTNSLGNRRNEDSERDPACSALLTFPEQTLGLGNACLAFQRRTTY
jgi:hypothetical protein